MTKELLNVPYKSQGDPDAPERNDCGPTCVAMLLAAGGHPTSTKDVYAKTGATGGLISTSQLQVAAQAYQMTLTRFQTSQADWRQDLRAYIDQGTPFIALIKYSYLQGRQVEYADGHFVVVVGYDDAAGQIFINDPLYSGARRDEGAYHPQTEADWEKAWGLTAEDGNRPYVALVPTLKVPFVTTGVDIPMARRRVLSRLAYDGKSDYNGTPLAQLDDTTVAQLVTQWPDWPGDVDQYTVQLGEGKHQISSRVYGTGQRWPVLQYFNDLPDSTFPAQGMVLNVPRPVAYVLSTVTRWGGLKIRPLPDPNSQAFEQLPANTPIILLSVPLTIISINNGVVQADPWINQPGDVWVRVRTPFGKEGWARWKYAQDNEIYLAYKKAPYTPPFWGAGKCLAGVGVANPWPFVDADYGVISTADMELIKLISPSNQAPGQGADIATRLIHEGRFVMARLFEKPGGHKMSANEFVTSVAPGFEALYKAGVRHFEIHNEPNLPGEGLGVSWADGAEFAAWFTAVYNALKARHADVQLGYPGLSPQFGNPAFPPQTDTWAFLDAGAAGVQRADWIGVHCYWQFESNGHWGMLSDVDGMLWQKFRARWPSKLLFITEFSNNGPNVDYATKGQQYGRYFGLLRHEPNLAGAVAFALYWPGQDDNHEGWRTDGGVNAIPAQVGNVVGQPDF
jgi:hypothetical protein